MQYRVECNSAEYHMTERGREGTGRVSTRGKGTGQYGVEYHMTEGGEGTGRVSTGGKGRDSMG